MAEHLTSSFIGMALRALFAIDPGCVTTSAKDQQDINVDNTLGKYLQIALVITPCMAILGWITGVSEMTLLVNYFEISTLFLSVIIVNYITSNGKANWLQGALLIMVFVIISLAAYYIPD